MHVFRTTQQKIRITRILLAAFGIFTLLLTLIESNPLWISDTLSLLATTNAQATTAQQLAKDALVMQYGNASDQESARTDMQSILPGFEGRQQYLSSYPSLPSTAQYDLVTSQPYFVGIDSDAHALLMTYSADPATVARMQARVLAYTTSFTQMQLTVHDDGETRQLARFILEAICNTGMLLTLLGLYLGTSNAASEKQKLSSSDIATIINTLPQAALVVDKDGTIKQYNAFAQEIFGYPDMSDYPVELLVPREKRPEHKQHREKYLAHPTARKMGEHLNINGLHQDGHQIPLNIALAPLSIDEQPMTLAIITPKM